MRYKDSVNLFEVVKKRGDFTEENFQDLVSLSYSEIIEHINKTFGDEREINEMYSSYITKEGEKSLTHYSGIFAFLHPDGIIVSAEIEYIDKYPPDQELYIFQKALFNLFSDTTPVDFFKKDLERVILGWKPAASECFCHRRLDEEKLFNSLNNIGIEFG